MEDLILMSSEKAVLDNTDLSIIVNKFAAAGRALPLRQVDCSMCTLIFKCCISYDDKNEQI
jgi:hypothetical protein